MTVTAMPFMEPVLRRGRSYLDRELLPGDENESRLTRLLGQVTEQGLDGVVLFGAAHLPESLVYYANYTPTTFHGALVARPGHPPVLFAGKGGARDHPYIRTVSWVADIRYAADLGQAIRELTADWEGGSGRLGVSGLDTTLPHHVRDGIVSALQDRLVPIDEMVLAQRRAKSAREVELLRRAGDLARSAAAAANDAAGSGAGRRTALAAADYTARAGGAHDCRITAATETGGVSTIAEVADEPGAVTALIAVEYLGYWGLASTVAGTDLDQVVSASRPGAAHPDGVLVNGIGCGLAEAPRAGDPLAAGDVVTVVRGFDVRTVLVTPEGGWEL